MKLIDMHCDTIGEIYRRRCSGENIGLASNPLQIDLEKLKAGNYGLQNFGLFTYLKETDRPTEFAMEMLDTIYTEMEANQDKISPVTTWKEIEDNWNHGRLRF